MKLHLENIGAIGAVDVDLEGITVIAGENSTGKSTVGRTLYTMLHDMSNWPEQYADIRTKLVSGVIEKLSVVLEDYCMMNNGARRRRTSRVNRLLKETVQSEQFMSAIEDAQYYKGIGSTESDLALADKKKNDLIRELSAYCEQYIRLYTEDEEIIQKFLDSFAEAWCIRTAELLNEVEIDELEVQEKWLEKVFSLAFKNQFQRIGTNKSLIQWTDDTGREVEISFLDGKATMNLPIRITESIYYLESPKVFDLLSDGRYGPDQETRLWNLLSPNSFIRGSIYYMTSKRDAFRKAESEDLSLNRIWEALETTMEGKAEFNQKEGLKFKDKKLGESIHSVNISAGLKSLALLEYALRVGVIQGGDILILDEPEINLHPKWQSQYAEVLVKLQKEHHLKIIVASHSPYFIRAIEVYSDLNGTMDSLNVYLMERGEDNTVRAENVSYSEYGVTEVYERLSASLDDLEKLLEEKYES